MAVSTRRSKRRALGDGGRSVLHAERSQRVPADATQSGLWTPTLVASTQGGTMLRLRKRLRMTRETFGRLADISVRTLAGIEAGRAASPKFRRKMTAVQRIADALREIVAEEAVGPWLETPNEALGGAKPLELIERGETDRIWQMIYVLRAGGAG